MANIITKPFLLFDLDGTISDPLEGIWRCINFALEHLGYEPCTKDVVAAFIGPPLDETFEVLTGERDKDKMHEFVVKYRERFSCSGYSENELYPGVADAIKCLAEAGVPLGVCTSKRADFAEKILKMFKLYDYFEFISGGDVGIKKSQQIKLLLSDKRISTNAFMIGDRYVDMRAARENSIRSVGVLWGYGSKKELEAEYPHFLLAHTAELKDFANRN